MTAALLLLRAHWGKVLVAAALAALLLTIAGQAARVDALKLSIAQAEAVTAKERTVREKIARDHEAELGRRERLHAAQQQERENAYQSDRAALATARAADAAAARSLRDKLAVATARSVPRGAVDTAACERDADRLEALGRLAGEGAELVAEARGLLDQRDIEVAALIAQIAIDRAALAAP